MTDLTRVLLLETEFSESQLLATAFRKNGWLVAFVSDPAYVIKTAQTTLPNVIVLAGQLKSGALEALKLIRASVYTAKIPVLVTDVLEKAEGEVLLMAGAHKCCGPNADPAAVRSAVEWCWRVK